MADHIGRKQSTIIRKNVKPDFGCNSNPGISKVSLLQILKDPWKTRLVDQISFHAKIKF